MHALVSISYSMRMCRIEASDSLPHPAIYKTCMLRPESESQIPTAFLTTFTRVYIPLNSVGLNFQ